MIQLLRVLRARYPIALLVLVVTVAVTVAVSSMLPKKYEATSTVLLDVKSPDPISGMMLHALVMPGYMATQKELIESDRVANEVVKKVKWDQYPTVREEWLIDTEGKGRLDVWLAHFLQKHLNVKPGPESSIIRINYTAKDPDFAAAIANAYAQAFINTIIELKVEPAKQYSAWFGQQSTLLRDRVERAQVRLSTHQQKHGIVANEEQLDSETTKLNALTAQLTVVQAQTADALSKQRSGRSAEALPEVTRSPLVATLRAQIGAQEAKLEQLAGNIGENHPTYQQLVSEIAVLKQQLDIETRHVMSGFTTSRNVSRSNEAQLSTAINAQKRKLLKLKSYRDELAVLTRDVDAAKKAYDTVTDKLNQVRLESQSTQTNASVLTPAARPNVPSSPKVLLYSLIAAFLGTVLGIGAALALEMRDRRIRSADDLVRMLPVPVLGVIGPARAERMLALGYRPALAVNRRLDIEV